MLPGDIDFFKQKYYYIDIPYIRKGMVISMKRYILALDSGTTSCRAILFDKEQNIIGIAGKEFKQLYPRAGWVEHDPLEIYAAQYGVMMEVLIKSGVSETEIAAIGITNQRETAVVWDKKTGAPIYNAIVWQCRRTADYCETLKKSELAEYIQNSTGLVIDAYFTGTKIRWILDNVEGARELADKDQLMCGTVDSWLLYKLTGEHKTDRTNASRTMLYNIHDGCWDDKILAEMSIPKSMLPEVCPSGHMFGEVNLSGNIIPITGIAGDQQSALYGQTCFSKGDIKNTYGTGCFMLMNTGDRIYRSKSGLLTSIAATAGEEVHYVLEGSVFTGGAVIQWLRDEMRLIHEARDVEYFASKVDDTGGVYIVPAFTGLGAPHWDMYARGTIIGITRGTKREHIIRAAQEAIAYQSADLLRCIEQDTEIDVGELRVDGGASADNFLMQFQADVLGVDIRRPMIRETTALGAAYLAGLTVGLWQDTVEIGKNWTLDKIYSPNMNDEKRTKLLYGWHRAVEHAKGWIEKSE